jgi:enoyl-CoA hydratase/carnithine racemase
MAALSLEVGPFRAEIDEQGIAVVVFDRPPVNAVSMEVYEALAGLADLIEAAEDARVVVLTAPVDARAWCAGADLNDFVGMVPNRRKQRYARINELLPRLYELDRPTIAAINAHVVGIGVVIAALCDIRVAADTATFACREIDYGIVPGEGGLLAGLGVPSGTVREMLFSARRFSAAEMQEAGFVGHVVPREQVLARSREIAAPIAAKSLPALRASKRVFNAIDGMGWREAYLLAQEASAAELTATADAAEGINAFLEGRVPRLVDR